MLYYIQGFHLVSFDKPLFDDEIEAWMYRPVVLLSSATLSFDEFRKHLARISVVLFQCFGNRLYRIIFYTFCIIDMANVTLQ